MTIQFRHAALISSFICGALFLAWMFAPAGLLHLWGVAYSNTAGIVARRNAALFGGLALMLFLARKAPPGVARYGISAGLALSCAMLALLGVLEYKNGTAGAGIITAVVTEIAMVVVFFGIWSSDRKLLQLFRNTG